MVSLAARIYWNAAIQAKLVQQRTGRRLLQNSLRSIAATFVSTSDASMFVEQVDVLYSTVLYSYCRNVLTVLLYSSGYRPDKPDENIRAFACSRALQRLRELPS